MAVLLLIIFLSGYSAALDIDENTFIPVSARIVVYKCKFSFTSIRDWNSIPSPYQNLYYIRLIALWPDFGQIDMQAVSGLKYEWDEFGFGSVKDPRDAVKIQIH